MAASDIFASGIQPSSVRNGTSVAFDFVIPCWGESHTKLFLDVCLPSLLAPGNLPAISSLGDSRFCLYTTDVDFEKIRHSPAFAVLKQLITVEVHFPKGLKGDRYEKMSSCHRHAIASAESRRAAVVCLGADLVMANGSLAAISRLADSGKRVVLSPGISVVAEEALPVFAAMANSSDHAIVVSPRDLFDVAISRQHPRWLMHVWGSGSGEMHPSNLFWRVDEEGFIGRCFHLSCLMVHPSVEGARFNSTIDYDFVLAACPDPRDWYTITDSDELMFCELSFSSRTLKGMRKDSIGDVISFAESTVSQGHLHNARSVIRLHGAVQTPAKWEAAADEMDQVMNQVTAAIKRSSSSLLLSDPALLLRRLNRIAQDVERVKQAQQDIATLQLTHFERLAGATVGTLVNRAHGAYARFVLRYLPIRARIVTLIFGKPPRLRPWHWEWLERSSFYSACSATPARTGSDNLFVSEAGLDGHTDTSILGTTYLLPSTVMRPWPFPDSRFSNVHVLLHPQLKQHEIRHVFAEATRVLQPGGGLVAGGLPGAYLANQQMEMASGRLTVVTVHPQGNGGSAAGIRFSKALQAILKQIPARIAIEILLFPLVIGASVIGFGLLNALGRVVDWFDNSHSTEPAVVLSARKNVR